MLVTSVCDCFKSLCDAILIGRYYDLPQKNSNFMKLGCGQAVSHISQISCLQVNTSRGSLVAPVIIVHNSTFQEGTVGSHVVFSHFFYPSADTANIVERKKIYPVHKPERLSVRDVTVLSNPEYILSCSSCHF